MTHSRNNGNGAAELTMKRKAGNDEQLDQHGTQARELNLRVVKRTHHPKDGLDGPLAEVLINIHNAFVTFLLL